MKLTKLTTGPNPYKDIYVRIIISLIGAHFIVAFARPESLVEMLKLWDYHRDLWLNFLMAYALITYINKVSWALDERYSWKRAVKKRVRMQLLWGWAGAMVLDFFLAIAFFLLHAPGTLERYFPYYLRFDYPVIGLLILILNIYYFAYYWVKEALVIPQQNKAYKNTFVVAKGAKNIPIEVGTIAYFFHEGEYNFLRTFNGEDFLVTQPLDDIKNALDPSRFFRANRQVLVSFAACGHYEPFEHGKLILFVQPPYKELVVISQTKVKSFKEWIER